MSESDQASGGDGGTQAPQTRTHKRILRAVFAADIAGFSSKMSLNETSAVSSLSEIRAIGLKELETYNGWLFGMPGDGFFALFESAVGAVQCGLEIQRVLSGRPHLGDMPLRIGIHLGEVLIDEGLPYGETLNIAARLESLCKPGEMLVSGPVMDAVSARVSATFEERGVPRLKNIPRRVATFAVKQPPARTPTDAREVPGSSLDRTTRLDREALRRILDEQAVVQIVKRDASTEAESSDDIGVSSDPDASEVPIPAAIAEADDSVSEATHPQSETVEGTDAQMGFPVPIAPEQIGEPVSQ
ncbi:MAG: adenylate/guanylate cyclase domain-containing protein, partial [Pseudomonadota bacterium]